MIRRVLAGAALAAAAVLVAVIPAGPAQARACRTGFVCTTVWFSDSAHTSVVGTLYEDCDGVVHTSGTRSAYVTFNESPC